MTRLWDRATGKQLFEVGHLDSAPASVSFSPDGKRLVSISGSGTAILVETTTGKKLRTFQGEERGNWWSKVAFSPDGKLLAMSFGTSAVHLYDADTGETVRKLDGDSRDVTAIAFAPDGRTLASAVYGTVRLWDVWSEWKCLRLTGHNARVTSVAFSPDGRTLASADTDGIVRLWEVGSGKERRQIEDHWAEVTCVAFAPSGKLLATGSDDTKVLFWGLPEAPEQGQQPAPSEKELKGLWADLAGEDAAKAYRAIWTLAASPQQAVPFLRKHLKPAVPAEPQKLKPLLADLDSPRFAVREKAIRELAKLGDLAEPALKGMLEKKPSLEVRQRVERLLEQLQGSVVTPDRLREIRAVEALEHIGTAEARRLLEQLAEGAEGARLTREARASYQRLTRRDAGL
jgi:dipeptidyl aminopeptidase/acylaminoacyl peptidase